MQIIDTQIDIPWMPTPNRVRLVIADKLPPTHLTTSAFALAFDGEHLLMTKLAKRGWDLPGGHIEPGESAEATARREVLEETACVLGQMRLLGYQHLSLLCAMPADYRYPYPDSYQVFFVATVAEVRHFEASAEATERGFFDPVSAQELPWVQKHRSLYEMALKASSR